MLDEFEVNADDESAYEVAEQVVRVRGECLRGKFDEVEALRRRFESKRGTKVVAKKVEDEDNETDWDTDDEDEDDDNDDDKGSDEDVEMGEAPPAVRKEKEAPEVDEDGFTKVSRKKK
jgi:pre-rRNA-processing protein TSR2